MRAPGGPSGLRALACAGLFLVSLPAGCGTGGGGGAAGGGAGEGGTPAASPARERLSGPLVYERSGGFVGRQDRLIVQPDGRASLRTRTGAAHPLRLTRGELMRLLDELRAARFSSLPAHGGGTRPIPDAFSYRVSYGGHTVSADSQSIPRRLRPILATLMKIAARAAGG